MLELRPKKTQADIAEEAGFMTPNRIAMFKSGASKVPLDRASALAMALDCGPARLLRLALDLTDGDKEARGDRRNPRRAHYQDREGMDQHAKGDCWGQRSGAGACGHQGAEGSTDGSAENVTPEIRSISR